MSLRQLNVLKSEVRRFLPALVCVLLFSNVSWGRSNNVDLRFTATDTIDQSVISQWDRSRPLFFRFARKDLGAATVNPLFTADAGTNFRIWLEALQSASRASSDDRAIGMQITSNVDADAKDKIVFSVALHSGPDSVDITSSDTRRFLTFDFMLDPNYEVPSAWVIHLQAFQCCGTQPPFTMSVTPNPNPQSPVELTFGFRNDAELDGSWTVRHTIYKMIVQRGVWNKISLRLEPRAVGDSNPGSIVMSFNGEERFAHNGPWGYRPRGGRSARGSEVRPNIGFDLGIYRRRQQTTQIVYFKDISLEPPR